MTTKYQIVMIAWLMLRIGPAIAQTPIEDEDKKIGYQMAGLAFGTHRLSMDVERGYFEGNEIKFGSLSPFTAKIFFQQHWANNFIFNLELNGLASRSLSANGIIGTGYRIGPKFFNFIPMLGIGYGSSSTYLREIRMDTMAIISNKVFIGPAARGKNPEMSIKSGFFIIKPEMQLQVRIGKLSLIGSYGYNLALQGKGQMKISGTGYESWEQYQEAPENEVPPDLSLSTDISGQLKDIKSASLERTPLRYSGIFWNIGVGFKL